MTSSALSVFYRSPGHQCDGGLLAVIFVVRSAIRWLCLYGYLRTCEQSLQRIYHGSACAWGAERYPAQRSDGYHSRGTSLPSIRSLRCSLEAADLVQSGISKRVAVFVGPSNEAEVEFIRRGLPYEDPGTRQIRQLRSLGVTDVVRISRVDGTEGEGEVLPQWCDEHQLRSIVFVATKDHSRRSRRVLNRVMKGHPTRVTVKPARYTNFDPDRWWKTRNGIRIEIIELQKLLFDIVLHPMSF